MRAAGSAARVATVPSRGGCGDGEERASHSSHRTRPCTTRRVCSSVSRPGARCTPAGAFLACQHSHPFATTPISGQGGGEGRGGVLLPAEQSTGSSFWRRYSVKSSCSARRPCICPAQPLQAVPKGRLSPWKILPGQTEAREKGRNWVVGPVRHHNRLVGSTSPWSISLAGTPQGRVISSSESPVIGGSSCPTASPSRWAPQPPAPLRLPSG